jgi:hypothetical protein
MFDPIQVAISKAVTDNAAQLDSYLLSFFGSEEEIQKFGGYYILETKPSTFEMLPDENDMSFRFQLVTEYRLRLKTKEELEEG